MRASATSTRPRTARSPRLLRLHASCPERDPEPMAGPVRDHRNVVEASDARGEPARSADPSPPRSTRGRLTRRPRDQPAHQLPARPATPTRQRTRIARPGEARAHRTRDEQSGGPCANPLHRRRGTHKTEWAGAGRTATRPRGGRPCGTTTGRPQRAMSSASGEQGPPRRRAPAAQEAPPKKDPSPLSERLTPARQRADQPPRHDPGGAAQGQQAGDDPRAAMTCRRPAHASSGCGRGTTSAPHAAARREARKRADRRDRRRPTAGYASCATRATHREAAVDRASTARNSAHRQPGQDARRRGDAETPTYDCGTRQRPLANHGMEPDDQELRTTDTNDRRLPHRAPHLPGTGARKARPGEHRRPQHGRRRRWKGEGTISARPDAPRPAPPQGDTPWRAPPTDPTRRDPKRTPKARANQRRDTQTAKGRGRGR